MNNNNISIRTTTTTSNTSTTRVPSSFRNPVFFSPSNMAAASSSSTTTTTTAGAGVELSNNNNSNNDPTTANNNFIDDDVIEGDLQVAAVVDTEEGHILHQQDIINSNETNNIIINPIKKLQNWSHIVAHILSLIALLIVSWWIHILGGLTTQPKGNSKLVFNYHPLFMIIAFCFMTIATLSFQHYNSVLPLRPQRKFLHGLSWTCALLCGFIALIAVFQSHNDSESGYIANLYSLHSWIGIIVTILYVVQWLIGIGSFGLGFGSSTFKGLAVIIHKYVGPILYQAVAITILLGIQEKEGFVGCSYKVETKDTFPIQHFFDIPLACRVSHILGLIVLMMSILTIFAIQEFPSLMSSTTHHSYARVPLLRSD